LFILVLFFVFTIPKLTLAYYETRGYSFKENAGYVQRFAYDMADQNFDIKFENEVFVYYDKISLNDISYSAFFSSNEIFDVGMPPDLYTMLSNFYEFEFLYGEPFSNHNEIVISESISMELFNKINSIDETIIINDLEFVISGVVREPEDSMDYIYLSDDNIEIVAGELGLLFDFVMFQDQELDMKLYERGGAYLVLRTSTVNNQQTLTSTFYIIFLLSMWVISFIRISTYEDNSKNKDVDKPLKSFITSYIVITIYIIFSIGSIIFFIAQQVTYKVALAIVLDESGKYLWILSIYIIPILIYIIKRLRNKNKICVSSNH
jgi:hypothetical protein